MRNLDIFNQAFNVKDAPIKDRELESETQLELTDNNSSGIGNFFSDTALPGSEIITGDKLDQDYTKYEDDIDEGDLWIENLDQAENIAFENQGGFETGAKFLGNIITGTIAETLKIPGYLVGGVGALATGDITQMTDNWYVKAIEDVDEEIKASMPVWIHDSIKEGNFLDKISSGAWWATDGASGISFFLSSYLTGAGMVKLIGSGAKSAKAIGLIQTINESAAETAGLSRTLDEKYEALRDITGGYKLDAATAKALNRREGDYLNEEEVKQLKANALQANFALNAAMLLGPNLFSAARLFGKDKRLANVFSDAEQQGEKILKTGTNQLDDIKTQLGKFSKEGATFKDYSLEFGKLSGAEALQELSQFGISKSLEELSATQDDIFTKTYNTLSNMVEGFSDVEGQTSMFLGGLLGGASSIISTKRKINQRKETAGALSKLISGAEKIISDELLSITEYSEKDNSLQLNIKKVIGLLNENDETVKLLNSYYENIKNNKPGNANIALAKTVAGIITPFLKSPDGYVVWDALIKDIAEKQKGDSKLLGFESEEDFIENFRSIGQLAKKEYGYLKRYGSSKFEMLDNELIKKYNQNGKAKEYYDDFLNILNDAYISTKVIDHEIKRQKAQVDAQIQEEIVEGLLSNEEIEFARDYGKNWMPTEEFNKLSERDKDELNKQRKADSKKLDAIKRKSPVIKSLLGIQDDLNKKLEASKKNIDTFFNQAEQDKAFELFVKEQIELEEKQKELRLQAEKAKTYLEDFDNNLKQKGFISRQGSPDLKEGITLLDVNGVEYQLKEVEKDGTVSRILINMEDGTRTKFDANRGMALFPNADNILSVSELAALRKQQTIERNIESAYEAIDKVIEEGQIVEAKREKLDRLNNELVELEKEFEELKVKKDNAKRVSKKLLTSLANTQSAIISTREKIEKLNSDINYLETALDFMDELKESVEEMRNEGVTLHSLIVRKEKILKRGFTNEDVDGLVAKLEKAVKEGEKSVTELMKVRKNLEHNKNVLEKVIKKLLSNNALSKRDSQLLSSVLNKTGQELLDFLETEEAIDVLESLEEEVSKKLDDTIEQLKKELKQLNKDYDLLNNKIPRYNTYVNAVKAIYPKFKTIMGVKKAETLRKQNSYSNISPEQTDKVDEVVEYKTLIKGYEFSTTTSLYKTDANGNPILVNGKKVLVDNSQQPIRWNNALDNIHIKELSQYSVEYKTRSGLLAIPGFNEKTLPKFGKKAGEEELFVVLVKNGKVVTDAAGPVFTGIYYTETAFPKGKEAKIHNNTNNIYLAAESKFNNLENKDDFKFTYKGKTYTDLKSLSDAITKVRKKEYKEWRKTIVDKLNSGNEVAAGIKRVSPGHPAEIGNTINKVTDVFGEIDEILIGGLNNVSLNQTDVTLPLKLGMPYARLKKNGQIVRLLNTKISDLPKAQQETTLKRIIGMLGMSVHLNDLSKRVSFKGEKAGSLPYFQNGSEPSVLSLFLNLSSQNEKASIDIYQHPQNLEEIKIKVTKDGVIKYIPVSKLFKTGSKSFENIIDLNTPDADIQMLIDVLKTKFLNVNASSKTEISFKNGGKQFKLPTSWEVDENGNVLMSYQKFDKYADYVKKIVHTKIVKNEEYGPMINKYLELDKDLSTPEQINKKTKATTTSQAKGPQVLFGGNSVPDNQGKQAPVDSQNVDELIDNLERKKDESIHAFNRTFPTNPSEVVKGNLEGLVEITRKKFEKGSVSKEDIERVGKIMQAIDPNGVDEKKGRLVSAIMEAVKQESVSLKSDKNGVKEIYKLVPKIKEGKLTFTYKPAFKKKVSDKDFKDSNYYVNEILNFIENTEKDYKKKVEELKKKDDSTKTNCKTTNPTKKRGSKRGNSKKKSGKKRR